MADSNIEYTFKLENGGEKQLRYLGPIGNGSLGTVIKMQEGNKIYAAKFSTRKDDEDFFLSNAHELFINPNIALSVPIEAIGTIQIEGVSRATILMPYCGRNLSEVLTYLEGADNISDNVQEAFAYKTVLQVLNALDFCYKKDVCHGDLQPRNILTNIDIPALQQQSANGLELEMRLINERTQLCDRVSSGHKMDVLGSYMFRSAMTGNYLKYLDFEAFANKKINPDIKPSLAMMQDLLWRYVDHGKYSAENVRDNLDVFDFGREFFNAFTQAKDGKKIYPTAAELMKKVQSLVQSSQYFFLDKDTSQRGFEVPIVLRPVDKFIRVHSEPLRYTPDAKSFEVLHNVGEHSLLKMLARGGAKQSAAEKQKIVDMFSDVLEVRVAAVVSEIRDKVQGRAPYENKLTEIHCQVAETKKSLADAQTSYEVLQEEIKSLTQQFSVIGLTGKVDLDLIGRIAQTGTNAKGMESKVQEYTVAIEKLNASIPQVEQEMKKFGCSSLTESLFYVRDNCLKSVTDISKRERIQAAISATI